MNMLRSLWFLLTGWIESPSIIPDHPRGIVVRRIDEVDIHPWARAIQIECV
jgi:hypothetical protein